MSQEIASAKLLARTPLTPRLLLLDGLGRAGKFLLAKVVSNFERVEYFQYAPLLEHIPILWRLRCLTTEVAIPFLQLNVDLLVYDRAVGRNLNTRKDDSSSLGHSSEYKMYLDRAMKPDGEVAVKKLLKEERIPSFLTHEVLPNVQLYFEAYPDLQMINIQRHPVDLVHSWHQRSWGTRFGNDPLAFIPVIEGAEVGIPWFAESWAHEYEKMSPTDRIIKGILTVWDLERKTYESLSEEQKSKILFIIYEHILTFPEPSIKKISVFLGCKTLSNMTDVLAKEGSPRKLPAEERRQKFQEIQKTATKLLSEKLLAVSKEYEKIWDVEPFC